MSESYLEDLKQYWRSHILSLLVGACGKLNDSVLQAALDGRGLVCSSDQVLTELAWLTENGYVTTDLSGRLIVVTLTKRGEDVATGRCTVPGIRRPDRV